MDLRELTRPALLGVVAGGRSSVPFAALSWTTAPGRPWGTSSGLGRLADRRVRAGVTVAVVGELVADKLPQTPSRLGFPGLPARLVIGAAGGACLVARSGGTTAAAGAAAVAGLAGAVVGSYLGASWRASARVRFGSDLPGAVIEDAAVLAGAVVATTRV